MGILRRLLFALGCAMAVFGALFLVQGTGWFPYPANSFMINSQEWVVRGAGIAALGLIVIVISRRL